MSMLMQIAKFLPGVESPTHDQTFRDKLKWTGIILLLYFIMSEIVIYGADPQQIAQFEQLQAVMGSEIGSLITLGIGPIVTASIILQMLVGSQILPWDTNTQAGKEKFQATQKLLMYFFTFFEALAFVGMGAIAPAQNTPFWFGMVVGQVALGGVFIIMMDEVIKKWGFGSGVSLFILAGVSKAMVIQLLTPFTGGSPAYLWFVPEAEGQDPQGFIPQLLTGGWDLASIAPEITGFIFTILVFVVAVYAQAMRVEIPLTFGNVRGFGQKWPLKFVYTNVIPVIFVGALLANFQLMGSAMAGRGIELSIAGFEIISPAYTGDQNPPANTLLYYFSAPTGFVTGIIASITQGSLQIQAVEFLQVFVYTAFYVIMSAIFSIFWMRTSSQDPKSVAQQISNIGMKIPGHRKDIRVIERILNRYIPPLAVLGGAFVGLLAAVANWTNAYGTGTGILLAVMIAYKLYEEIAQKHMEDMHPAFRKFMGKMEG